MWKKHFFKPEYWELVMNPELDMEGASASHYNRVTALE